MLDEAKVLGLKLAAEVETDVREHTNRRAAARIVPSEVEVVTEVEFLEVVSPAAPPALCSTSSVNLLEPDDDASDTTADLIACIKARREAFAQSQKEDLVQEEDQDGEGEETQLNPPAAFDHMPNHGPPPARHHDPARQTTTTPTQTTTTPTPPAPWRRSSTTPSSGRGRSGRGQRGTGRGGGGGGRSIQSIPGRSIQSNPKSWDE
jgi:hypothetical protein